MVWAGEGGFQIRPYITAGQSGRMMDAARADTWSAHTLGESPSPQPSPVKGEGVGKPRGGTRGSVLMG